MVAEKPARARVVRVLLTHLAVGLVGAFLGPEAGLQVADVLSRLFAL